MPAPTFRKQERIVSLKLMETLFEKGSSHSVAAFPLRAIYTETERQSGCAPVQVLISVPKKRFKHAVDRNRVKRQVREAYRKHKDPVVEKIQEGRQLLIAFIWLSDAHFPSAEIEKWVKSLIAQIAKKI